MQNLSHYEKVFRVLMPLSVHKQKIESNANITMGVAVRLIIFQPNCEVLALQFISQPEVIDDKATKPKTRKISQCRTIPDKAPDSPTGPSGWLQSGKQLTQDPQTPVL